MYKYKRGVNNIDQAKKLEYMITDNLSTCLSMTANLEFKRPYNGMYIQDGKVLMLGMLEKILINDKEYNMSQITTSINNICCDEYISSIDLEKDTFEYNIGSLSYKKTFYLYNKILCIEYEINNKENSNAKFKINPLLTYRKLDAMKTSNFLKFNQRKDKDGAIVNLSIMDQENIILKSKEFSWVQEVQFLNNIKHEYINTNSVKELYTEDSFIPGVFEIKLSPFETKKACIFVSSLEFDIDKLDISNIKNYKLNKKNGILENVAEEYVELRELACGIDNLDFEDKLISKIPYNLDHEILISSNLKTIDENELIVYINDLINIVKSIDGQYLSLGKIEKAIKILIKIRRYIWLIGDIKLQNIETIKVYTKLKLWYIESVNRLLQKNDIMELFYDFIREIIYSVLDNENKNEILNDIESISLMYNAIRIYENMNQSKNVEDMLVFNFRERLKNKIENEFWIDDLRLMKKTLDEREHIPTIEMIYTLSLSYPCIVGNIPIKLLDTIFKELYTPYGMREVPKNCEESNGSIYPKYMAHFVKANLRQNGVTRASQKIAYNLVKELMQDISRHVNGGIKSIYNEKGVNVDSNSYDLLTNAEIIRLYGMLT